MDWFFFRCIFWFLGLCQACTCIDCYDSVSFFTVVPVLAILSRFLLIRVLTGSLEQKRFHQFNKHKPHKGRLPTRYRQVWFCTTLGADTITVKVIYLVQCQLPRSKMAIVHAFLFAQISQISFNRLEIWYLPMISLLSGYLRNPEISLDAISIWYIIYILLENFFFLFRSEISESPPTFDQHTHTHTHQF